MFELLMYTSLIAHEYMSSQHGNSSTCVHRHSLVCMTLTVCVLPPLPYEYKSSQDENGNITNTALACVVVNVHACVSRNFMIVLSSCALPLPPKLLLSFFYSNISN